LSQPEHRGTDSQAAHSSGSGWVVGEGESIQSWRTTPDFSGRSPGALISRRNDLGTPPRSWSHHENPNYSKFACGWPTGDKSSAPVADQQSDVRTQVVTAYGLFVSRWVAGPKNAAHIPCQLKLLSTLALLFGAPGMCDPATRPLTSEKKTFGPRVFCGSSSGLCLKVQE